MNKANDNSCFYELTKAWKKRLWWYEIVGSKWKTSFLFFSLFLQFLLFFCIKDELCVLFSVGFGFCGFGNSYTKRQGNKNIHFFLFMSYYNDYKCRKNSTNFVILLERILECFSGTSTIVLIICDILSKQKSVSISHSTTSCLQMLVCWPINCGIIHIYFHTIFHSS